MKTISPTSPLQRGIRVFRILWMPFLLILLASSHASAGEFECPDEVDELSSVDYDLICDGMPADWATWFNTESDKDPVMYAQVHTKFRQVRHYDMILEKPGISTIALTEHPLYKGSLADLSERLPPPYYYIFLFRLNLF